MARTTKATTVKKTLEKRYLDFLGDEGYRPRADPDTDDLDFGVITFKSEGSTFAAWPEPIARKTRPLAKERIPM